jgi:hypothetical protein
VDAQGDGFRFKLPKEVCGGAIIGPQQDAFMAATLPDRLGDELAQRVKCGTGPEFLSVWGYVSYHDHFGRRHLCTFAQHVWWREQADKTAVLFGVYLSEHNRTN